MYKVTFIFMIGYLAIWLFDISITYDQRLLIEEIGYWVFVLGSVVGGMVIWKLFRVHTT